MGFVKELFAAVIWLKPLARSPQTCYQGAAQTL